MVTHELKSWPVSFQAIIAGEKTHEHRKNDRGFRTGDTLLLREWEPDTEKQGYTGRHHTAVITNITHGPDFGVPDGWCAMSIRLIDE